MHAATAGAKPVLIAAAAVGPDGRNNARRSLRGTYGSELLLGCTCARCNCIASVVRSASQRIQ
eukprot:1343615-Pleurochrysis_carterae.AAC.2